MKIKDKKDITTPRGEKATRISFTDDSHGTYSCYVYETGKIQVTTLHPYDDAEEDEGHRRKDHETVVHVTEVIETLRDYLESEQCS